MLHGGEQLLGRGLAIDLTRASNCLAEARNCLTGGRFCLGGAKNCLAVGTN